jgi:hypothetical protein
MALNTVATLTSPQAGLTYSLAANPNNYFVIIGTTLFAVGTIPHGSYLIVIQGNGIGISFLQKIIVSFLGPFGPILDISNPSNVELFPGAL